MSLRAIVIVVFLNSFFLFSQEKITKHTISKGETISSIAQKYDVNQSAILKLNPTAKNLLKLNSVLLIPIGNVTKSNLKTTSNQTASNALILEHEVLAKETLYGIAKQYGTTVKELNKSNPILVSSDLKIGQKINIPISSTTNPAIGISPTNQGINPTDGVSSFTWHVLPGETKYSIAKKYGISLNEFEKHNQDLGVKPLRVGQGVNIPGTYSNSVAPTLEVSTNKDLNKLEQAVVLDTKNDDVVLPQGKPSENSTLQSIIREVLPKETKYGIAKQYGITVKELENQNPEIKNNLLVGYKLNITAANVPTETISIATIENKDIAIQNTKIDFNNAINPNFNPEFLDQLIENASENIGSRYRTGGTTKSGFDCSGLMCTTFGAFDIKLPRTSREQSGVGTKINSEEAQKGDLIFFKTNGRNQINHVGMVVEVNEGEIKFIHSSVSNGVIISSTKEKYYQKNFSQINRVLQ